MTSLIETCISIILMIVMKLVSGFCLLRSTIFYFLKPKRCPPISNSIIFQSAVELSEKIRNRTISSEEIVKAYISRIQEVNPVLNAVMKERFKLAIEEARNVDKMLINKTYTVEELKTKRPLLGIPITIKESISVKGLTHSGGMINFKNRIATEDADVIQNIKNSGAIILLVSTTPELCLSLETFNKITGTTYNPYDTRRTPGGSSGGEAALISSGASLIGIGSDLIGSVRIPASFCGIWSHKPSSEVISIKGHYPYSSNTYLACTLSLGPITRYFPDLPLLLDVMLEENGRILLSLNKEVSLNGVKVYILGDNNEFPLSNSVEPEILLAINKIINHLQENCSCVIQQVELIELRRSVEACLKKLASIKGFKEIFENKPNGYYYKQLLLYLFGRSSITTTHLFIALFKICVSVLPEYVIENATNEIEKIKFDLHALLSSNGVLLLPTHPRGANFHGEVYGKVYDYGYTCIFNAIGFPATQCPVGLNSKGLPVGIQVVAVKNNDKLTLRVAEEINRLYGGWIPPTSLD